MLVFLVCTTTNEQRDQSQTHSNSELARNDQSELCSKEAKLKFNFVNDVYLLHAYTRRSFVERWETNAQVAQIFKYSLFCSVFTMIALRPRRIIFAAAHIHCENEQKYASFVHVCSLKIRCMNLVKCIISKAAMMTKPICDLDFSTIESKSHC